MAGSFSEDHGVRTYHWENKVLQWFKRVASRAKCRSYGAWGVFTVRGAIHMALLTELSRLAAFVEVVILTELWGTAEQREVLARLASDEIAADWAGPLLCFGFRLSPAHRSKAGDNSGRGGDYQKLDRREMGSPRHSRCKLVDSYFSHRGLWDRVKSEHGARALRSAGRDCRFGELIQNVHQRACFIES
jgi:hypothetical protein